MLASEAVREFGRDVEGLLKQAGAPAFVRVIVAECMGKHCAAHRDHEDAAEPVHLHDRTLAALAAARLASR